MTQPLWPDGPLLDGDPAVFPLGMDAVLLADFAHPRAGDRILDLGTGCGVLPLLLLWERRDATACAMDISADACRLAHRNLTRNGLAERCRVLEGDLRAHRTLLAPGDFDLTVSNPPYFAAERGRAAQGTMRSARQDESCTLMQLCEAAAWATRWGGRFCLVFRPERLAELFAALTAHRLTPKRLRPVHYSPDRPANLILVEARRGGSPGLIWEQDLFCTAQGQPTPEYLRIYHRSP